MTDREEGPVANGPGSPVPGKPLTGATDSLTKIFRDGFLTTGRVLHRIHRSGTKIVGKKIYRERVIAQERQEVEEHIQVEGACGHSLPNDPYTLPDGRKVCSSKCVARCENSRCQAEVLARELKEVGTIKVCLKCYRFCRWLETTRAFFRNILFWADRNG